MQTNVKADTPPKMPIRRNLCVSLPPQSPPSTRRAQALDEGMFPLQCTPEPPHTAVQAPPPNTDPNMTFEVLDLDQTACNDTIVIRTGSPRGSSRLSGPSQLPHAGRDQEGNQVPFKR